MDLFLLAFRFLARIVAGAVLLRVEMSRWFLLCGLLLSLFIALSNRRHGIVTRKERGDGDDELYSTTVIDQMVAVVTSATLVAYGLYTLSAQTVEKFGSGALTYTIPFVLYGIFRFLYLIYQKDTTPFAREGDPAGSPIDGERGRIPGRRCVDSVLRLTSLPRRLRREVARIIDRNYTFFMTVRCGT